MFERTASLWRRLTGRLRPESDLSARESEERRVWVRYPSNVVTQFAPLNGVVQSSVPARIRDVSLGGVQLVVTEAFEPGDMLSVTLPGEGESSMTVLACVVHCRAMANNEWALGCNFSAELEERQLLAFGAQKPKASGGDGRGGTRFPCTVKAFCQFPNQADDPAWEAQVLNVSSSGMAVKFERHLPTGALFSAELHNGNSKEKLTILACVVHVTIQPDGQRISGCNFIRELSEQDIRLLL
jgi:PilZ domain